MNGILLKSVPTVPLNTQNKFSEIEYTHRSSPDYSRSKHLYIVSTLVAYLWLINSSDDKDSERERQRWVSLNHLNIILKMFFSKSNLHILSELKYILLTKT